ncbi:MAG: hypothetical protein ACYC8V_04540 [Caulobacteraceae bacterium]
MPTGLTVDVENEFANLLREAALLDSVLPSLKIGEIAPDEARHWIEIAGVAASFSQLSPPRS